MLCGPEKQGESPWLLYAFKMLWLTVQRVINVNKSVMNNTTFIPNTFVFAQNIKVKFSSCFQEKFFWPIPKYEEPVPFLINSNSDDIIQYILKPTACF